MAKHTFTSISVESLIDTMRDSARWNSLKNNLQIELKDAVSAKPKHPEIQSVKPRFSYNSLSLDKAKKDIALGEITSNRYQNWSLLGRFLRNSRRVNLYVFSVVNKLIHYIGHLDKSLSRIVLRVNILQENTKDLQSKTKDLPEKTLALQNWRLKAEPEIWRLESKLNHLMDEMDQMQKSEINLKQVIKDLKTQNENLTIQHEQLRKTLESALFIVGSKEEIAAPTVELRVTSSL